MNKLGVKEGQIWIFHGTASCYKDSFLEWGSPYKILEVCRKGVEVEFVGENGEINHSFLSFDSFRDENNWCLCDLNTITLLSGAVRDARCKLMDYRNLCKNFTKQFEEVEKSSIKKVL